MIGPDIVITVVDVERGKVRLGIDAPRELRTYRQELPPLEEEKDKEDRP